MEQKRKTNKMKKQNKWREEKNITRIHNQSNNHSDVLFRYSNRFRTRFRPTDFDSYTDTQQINSLTNSENEKARDKNKNKKHTNKQMRIGIL